MWHIDEGRIHVLFGGYQAYRQKQQKRRQGIENQLQALNREKKAMHETLMREQQRPSKSQAAGKKKVENRKWMKSTMDLKVMKAEKSQGKKRQAIQNQKQMLI